MILLFRNLWVISFYAVCYVHFCAFDRHIIHIVTGVLVSSMISLSIKTLGRVNDIPLNVLVLYMLIHVGHTPRPLVCPF